jgi:uncharacterized membrane protein YccF (DUF307 family)
VKGGVVTNPYSTSEKIKYALKLLLAMMWAVPWILLAVILAITFLGIPLAMVCWVIGSYPYNRIAVNQAKAKYTYMKQGRAMDPEGEVPWEM